MIVRPKELEFIDINIEFNDRLFEQLEVDLAHVNKNGRSIYTALQAAKLVKQIIGGRKLAPSASRAFKNEICLYYVATGDFKLKNYKVVFCICSDKPNAIGLITLFKESK